MIRPLAVHTHQRPLFGEPFEPGQRGGFRYPPVVRFFQQQPAGKLVLHLGKEHILVRRAPALDNGGGQKRKNMGGVQIKRLHQGKHGMEIIVCNHQVPARDDTVLQIIGRNMRVRFHQRRVFQASQDGDYRHHAARIDGKTDDGTAHLVPVDLAGTMEQLVEQEVELFMLGMSQLQGKQSPKRQLVQRVFPFVAHQAEFLVHIHLILAELVCPLGDAWHIIKVLAGEQTVLRRGDQGLYLCGRTREQHGEVASAHLLIFAVGAPVVGQAVVVERLAQRVAPVSVFGSYGGGYGVRLTFADDARSVGIHDILQDACSGVVSRYEEHPVGRQCGSFLIFRSLPRES